MWSAPRFYLWAYNVAKLDSNPATSGYAWCYHLIDIFQCAVPTSFWWIHTDVNLFETSSLEVPWWTSVSPNILSAHWMVQSNPPYPISLGEQPTLWVMGGYGIWEVDLGVKSGFSGRPNLWVTGLCELRVMGGSTCIAYLLRALIGINPNLKFDRGKDGQLSAIAWPAAS